MALTAPQFQAWLEDSSAVRCILAKISYYNGSEQTLYLSSKNYIADATGKAAGGTDTTGIPANTPFLPSLVGNVSFTENLSLDNTTSINYGDVAIDNTDGVNDAYIDYVWAGRTIMLYVGDPLTQSTENFTLIFNGTMSDIAFGSRNTINIQIRDILQRLNNSVSDFLVSSLGGGYATNQSKNLLLPLCFGEVFNVTPVLIDPANLIYMVHNGPIEGIIEVRDMGVPLAVTTGYTVNVSNGTFTLLKNPFGVITCSVQGSKPASGYITGYNNTVSKLIQLIVTTYGNSYNAANTLVSTNVLTSSNLDTAALATFDTSNPQPVGVYLNSKENVLNVCQRLAASVGAQITANRLGLVTLVKLISPTGPTRTITDEDIIQESLTVTEKVEVRGAYKLGFCRNYTVQSTLETGIPAANKDLFANEWLSVTVKDDTAITNYKLVGEPGLVESLLLNDAAGTTYATVEATRRRDLFDTPRYKYGMDCTAKLLSALLGDIVTLTHKRFNLSAGKTGQIVSITTNWDTNIARIEVFV